MQKIVNGLTFRPQQSLSQRLNDNTTDFNTILNFRGSTKLIETLFINANKRFTFSHCSQVQSLPTMICQNVLRGAATRFYCGISRKSFPCKVLPRRRYCVSPSASLLNVGKADRFNCIHVDLSEDDSLNNHGHVASELFNQSLSGRFKVSNLILFQAIRTKHQLIIQVAEKEKEEALYCFQDCRFVIVYGPRPLTLTP